MSSSTTGSTRGATTTLGAVASGPTQLPVADPVIDERIGDPILDDGDHDRFAHYVRKDKILPSAIEGTPVQALCGKKWVPNRDPQRFPVCPECKDIFDKLRDPKGGDPED